MRYFLEVAYKGTNYSGFQVQNNAPTIQGEITKAFNIFFKTNLIEKFFTGSSRTDAGVHAVQNFFHFDWPTSFQIAWLYSLNALLPKDIVIKKVLNVAEDAHCRFDAASRTYHYCVYQFKNPFIEETAYYYPYKLDIEILKKCTQILMTYTDFSSFSKKNTQVKTFNCHILQNEWQVKDQQFIYTITANRFLRGMVRALTATMLKAGRGIISIEEFKKILDTKTRSAAYFDAPARGLTLMQVTF